MPRSLLAALLLVAALGTAPARADRRTLWIRAVHSGEVLRLHPFARLGIPDRHAWAILTHLFRSWRTQERRPVNPRLIRILAQIQNHFAGRRLELISGYRVPENRSELHSYHGADRAADFYIEGIPNRVVFDYCRTIHDVGCGFYPNGHHVHVDARGRGATWVDLSRDGEAAKYVRDVDGWLGSRR